MKKQGFQRARSAWRCKKKRKFNKQAKPVKFKKYDDMKLGENVQIDHMTVTRNGVTLRHFVDNEFYEDLSKDTNC